MNSVKMSAAQLANTTNCCALLAEGGKTKGTIVYVEIFAEQEANRIFAIIFSRITGSSWKGSMLCTVTNL